LADRVVTAETSAEAGRLQVREPGDAPGRATVDDNDVKKFS
jgi:hypothetical protein